MTMNRWCVSTVVLLGLGTVSQSNAAVLFSDTFNRPDGPLDSTPPSPGEVGGSLAGTVGVQSQQIVQKIVGGKLQFQAISSGTSSIRFNNQYDWASGSTGAAIAAAGGLDITFNWTPVDASSNWIAWSAGIGAPDQAYEIVNAQTDSGMLLRNNGGTQAFAGGAAGGSNPGFTAALENTVDLNYSFNSWAPGSPVTLVTTVNGVQASTESFTWTHANNYMELASNQGGQLVSNLVISTVPEPTSIALLAIGSLGILGRKRRMS